MAGLIGGALSGVTDFLFGDGGEGDYQAATAALIDRMNKEWTLPAYDQTPLTPQEYTLLTQYAPQVAAFVAQQKPELLSDVKGPGQQAQTQALNQLDTLSKTGVDAGMRAQLEEAQMSADQSLRSNRANALAALANRGLGSSGATLGADIATSLGAAEQQRQASLEAASQAAQRKAQAIQGLGNLGTQIAGQEQQKDQFNANTLNQYNQLLANRRQQYEDYVAQTNNQANMYNQQQNQSIANANTGLNNQFNQYNRERDDRNKTNMANFANQKLETIAGLQGGANKQALQNSMQQRGAATGLFLSGIGLAAAAAGAPPAAAAAPMLASQASPNYSLTGQPYDPSSKYSLGVNNSMPQSQYDIGGGSIYSPIAD